MSQRRLEKISELLKETVAGLLLYKSKDPRLKEVNITGVKITADLKKAVIHYSVMGGPDSKKEAGEALAKASGFIRRQVSEELHLKYTPEIKFEFDRNLEYAQHMNDLLTQLTADGKPSEGDLTGEDDD